MTRSITLLMALSISACTLIGSHDPPKTDYDFGPQGMRPAQVSQPPPVNVIVYDVTAPAWMDHSSMYYRLAYGNDLEPMPYARSQWVMSPAALLTQRLRARLSDSALGTRRIGGSASQVFALHAELVEFEQIFDKPGTSRGVLRVRATVEGDGFWARRTFAVERPAPTADAAGGVSALAQCTEDLAAAVREWLSTDLPRN